MFEKRLLIGNKSSFYRIVIARSAYIRRLQVKNFELQYNMSIRLVVRRRFVTVVCGTFSTQIHASRRWTPHWKLIQIHFQFGGAALWCIYSLKTKFGLHTVLGSNMSNKWLFHFIIVCATELRMYIWYDDKIHFVCTYTCFRSTYLLITNIVCIVR